MTDIGFYLVIAYLFLVPWLVRWLRGPDSLAWPAFILGVALLVLYFMDRVHLFVPGTIGQPLSWVLMLATLIGRAAELLPRDRGGRPCPSSHRAQVRDCAAIGSQCEEMARGGRRVAEQARSTSRRIHSA